jgi:hypothetical protein
MKVCISLALCDQPCPEVTYERMPLTQSHRTFSRYSGDYFSFVSAGNMAIYLGYLSRNSDHSIPDRCPFLASIAIHAWRRTILQSVKHEPV